MNRTLVLGMDGGGTVTTTWIGDASGAVLGRGQAGPSNIKAVSAKAARNALDLSVLAAFEDAGLDVTPVEVSCLGLAGFDREEDKDWLHKWASQTDWVRRLILVNDGDLALAAGTPRGVGVALIAGTGSIAVGRAEDGRKSRAGGWGYLFGDEGSGYAIAASALRRVARRADGRDPRGGDDALTRHLCRALNIEDTAGLVRAIYGQGFDRAKVAQLAPAVIAASLEDQGIIDEIITPAGVDLADLVIAAARPLGWLGGPLSLAMAGGFLLHCDALSGVVLDQLAARGYDVQALRVENPVEGALMLARRELAVTEAAIDLLVDGAVEHSLRLSFRDLSAIPDESQIHDVASFHPGKKGQAVDLRALLTLALPLPAANYLTLHADRDDFHVSIPLEEIRDRGMVVYRLGDSSLSLDQGGPIRFLIRDPASCHSAELDDCANVKYLSRIELTVKRGRDNRPEDDAAHAELHRKANEPDVRSDP